MDWQPLVDQQFWLFGRDVIAEDGNRLIAMGARREAPSRRGKASCYRLPISPCTRCFERLESPSVMLWGFGLVVFEGVRPCCLLRRVRGAVRVAPSTAHVDASSEGWQLDSWPLSPTTEWASEIANWLAHYETHVADRYGVASRRLDVAAWDHAGKPTCAAASLPTLWHGHADRLAATDEAIDTIADGDPVFV